MGTSNAGSELHSDKLSKLQARKKELEALLAAKNEELYKLCVQEVNLTGIMPPEVPVETPISEGAEAAVEKNPEKETDTLFRKDPGDSSQIRRSRHSHRQSAQSDKGKEPASSSRKQMCHRLSTPSISGMSVKSAPARRTEHPSASCSTLSHDSRDTFSLHSSQTYPTLRLEQPATYSRHHTLTTEHSNKLFFSSQHPDTQSFSRVHETHFSSSHPDITTKYSHAVLTTQPAPTTTTPLLYQYASQLKARSSHMSSVQQRPRRNTLQRTQTYHLTAHSDHTPPHEALAGLTLHSSRQFSDSIPPHPTQYFPPSPLSPHSSQQFSVNTGSNPSIYSSQFVDQDQKVKEKEWYESSLDSPSNSSGMNLSKESIQYHSPKKTVQRSSSVNHPQMTLIESAPATAPEYPSPVPATPIQQNPIPLSPLSTMSQIPHSPLNASNPLSPIHSQHSPIHGQHSPITPANVPFESPKNCTVVESGKWIPYREVSKPFEMADFYKYSTKFRQNNNNNTAQKQRMVPTIASNAVGFPSPAQEEVRYPGQEQWRHGHPM